MTSIVLQDHNIILNRAVPHSAYLSGRFKLTMNLMLNHWRIWRLSSWRWAKE